jgi:RNA polymerase sigma-70 factor (ECF subfamily)
MATFSTAAGLQPPIMPIPPLGALGRRACAGSCTVSQPVAHDEVEARLKALFCSGLDGNRSDYEAFLVQLSGHLRAYLRKRLQQHAAEVEDLLQEALLAIHLHRHTWDRRQALTPWAYTITRHKLIDFTRRHARTDAHHDEWDDAHELLQAVDQEADIARRDVHKLLDLLPDRHRLPLLYTHLQGHSVAEAAQLSGMSESAVKIGVHRGLKALAALMRKVQEPRDEDR